mmetsp:Transcript_20214/g.48209  ORF Transcript_20214/g.48209 Transcript_20214/m.48209 type:complete len:106 (+) Transcript_20214:710-1027(+)
MQYDKMRDDVVHYIIDLRASCFGSCLYSRRLRPVSSNNLYPPLQQPEHDSPEETRPPCSDCRRHHSISVFSLWKAIFWSFLSMSVTMSLYPSLISTFKESISLSL